jgi:leader peptidase (prepilin peptidase)/N-methyltransferase
VIDWWPTLCAVIGAVAGGAASTVTRRYLVGDAAGVLSSWWMGALLTAGTLAILGWRVGARGEIAVYAVVAVLGVPLAVIDWVDRVLPKFLVWLMLAGTGAGFGMLCLVRDNPGPGLRAVVALLVLGGALLVLAVAVPGGVGSGDVRLAAVVGMVAGWSGWPTLAATLVLALALAAMVLAASRLWRRRGEDREVGVPFGPCLLAGAVMAITIVGG